MIEQKYPEFERRLQTDRPMWTYKGVIVHPAALNSSGIRWYALSVNGGLRSDTKEGMRRLITEALKNK